MEKESGVKSTYYFRFSTIDMLLIKEMISAGFEVGLHFETLADYVKENSINNITEVDFDIVQNRLKSDIERFSRITGLREFSICSHGAPENSKLQYANNQLLDGKSYNDYRILFEAYDKNMYDYVDCHIMDTRIIDNFGFSYVDNPVTAINSNKAKIIFLSHPNHWHYSWIRRIRFILLLMIGRYQKTTKRTFARRYQ